MFDYNQETNAITKDGEIIGGIDDSMIVLSADLAPTHKSLLKKYLLDSGYVVDGFRKAEDGDGVMETPASSEMPPQDPGLGDKTPEVVEWYRDNDPAEYQRRYRGRKTHLGTFH